MNEELKFSGPTAAWLEFCRVALRDFEKTHMSKYESHDGKVAEYIAENFKD